MIPVELAEEPLLFDSHVRKRGAAAIHRLLGKRVKGPGRKPKKTYVRAEQIPPGRFPEYWTEVRKSDDKSTLDDLMDAYGRWCAYLAMRLERRTGSPMVDHYVPKERNWSLVYEWSNYRLCAACVNGAKGTKDVIDPFEVKPGWFELDLDTYLVRRGSAAPSSKHGRIGETLSILNLRQCIQQRRQYIESYRAGEIELREVERYALFIASELRRQEQPNARSRSCRERRRRVVSGGGHAALESACPRGPAPGLLGHVLA